MVANGWSCDTGVVAVGDPLLPGGATALEDAPPDNVPPDEPPDPEPPLFVPPVDAAPTAAAAARDALVVVVGSPGRVVVVAPPGTSDRLDASPEPGWTTKPATRSANPAASRTHDAVFRR